MCPMEDRSNNRVAGMVAETFNGQLKSVVGVLAVIAIMMIQCYHGCFASAIAFQNLGCLLGRREKGASTTCINLKASPSD